MDRGIEADDAGTRLAAQHLITVLGPTLVASLAGCPDVDSVRLWAVGDGPRPDAVQSHKLAFAQEKWNRILDAENADLARAWAIGATPILAGNTFITAIREGRYEQVRMAVQALLDER